MRDISSFRRNFSVPKGERIRLESPRPDGPGVDETYSRVAGQWTCLRILSHSIRPATPSIFNSRRTGMSLAVEDVLSLRSRMPGTFVWANACEPAWWRQDETTRAERAAVADFAAHCTVNNIRGAGPSFLKNRFTASQRFPICSWRAEYDRGL